MAKERAAKAEVEPTTATKVADDKVQKAQKEKTLKAVTKGSIDHSDSSDSEDSSSNSASEASQDSASDSEEVKTRVQHKKVPIEVEPNALFTIDTKPTKTAPKAADTTAQNVGESSKSENTNSGQMNRKARRRLQLIGKQREALRKSLNLGADENSEALEAALNKWIADTDGKAAIRDRKKQDRKEKDAKRLRTRKGKLLKGRKLKERQKVLAKMERREKKKAQEQTQAEAQS